MHAPSSRIARAGALAALLVTVLAPGLRAAEDPYLWLEDIESERALDWVRAHNAITEAELESDPRWSGFLEGIGAILNATDRIPIGTERGGFVYDFWQDETNVRGVWRRTPLASYRTPDPAWEVILDVDALAAREDENWVFQGAIALVPDLDRALIRLSRGGGDAGVVREFDVPSKAFVAGGFELPEAKSDVAWLDRETLLVATDWGEGSLTESGYPRIVKRWRRGTPLASAETLFEARTTDVGAWPWVSRRPEGTTALVLRAIDTFSSDVFLLDGTALRPVPIPSTANLDGTFAGRLLFRLREAWDAHPQAALLALPLDAFRRTGTLPALETLLLPDDRTAIQGVRAGRSAIWVTQLREVQGRLLRLEAPAAPGEPWRTTEIALPGGGSVGIASASAFDDVVFATYQDYLAPNRVLEIGPDGGTTVLHSLPERFDASGMKVDRLEAVAPDGERIPYAVFAPKDLPLDGSTPTILYGYGGFEISQSPGYYWSFGKYWVARGGVFVMANIRGGGEFGPRWHRAALREKRQVSWDDFRAIAEDLQRRGISSPERLGIMGGSQGGLLVGVAMTQHPELYRAVVCQVPLLDMLRYTKLLAGASWAGEYGDPDDPAMRDVIAAYSPYQNVREGAEYPRTLFVTSTKDDRVHPGHARKMAARLEEIGSPFLYWENVEGGHAASANQLQRARRMAMEFVFFSRELGLE